MASDCACLWVESAFLHQNPIAVAVTVATVNQQHQNASNNQQTEAFVLVVLPQ
jgi:hypothetical protein